MDIRMLVTYVIVDIFCIIIAVSMGVHINRDFGSEYEVNTLRRALISYCGFLVFGLVGVLMEVQIIVYMESIVWLSNMASLFLLVMVSYFWCMFATTRLHNCFPTKWILYASKIPMVIVALLMITSPWTGYIFSVAADGRYQRGCLFISVYIPAFIYSVVVLVQAIIIGVREKQYERRQQCFIIGLFFLFPMVASVLQGYIAGMPILAPAIVTAFFLVFINMQSLQIYNDALTGLNNRRRAYHYLEEQLSQVCKMKPVTVFLMDINSFKQVNDQYGHAQGDKALMIVSTALVKLCKQHHLFVARYGGDEFILISTWRYPEIPETIMRDFREILEIEIEENKTPYGITVSIGYDVTVNGQETADEVINRADLVLYEEKHKHHKAKK